MAIYNFIWYDSSPLPFLMRSLLLGNVLHDLGDSLLVTSHDNPPFPDDLPENSHVAICLISRGQPLIIIPPTSQSNSQPFIYIIIYKFNISQSTSNPPSPHDSWCQHRAKPSVPGVAPRVAPPVTASCGTCGCGSRAAWDVGAR